MTPFGTQIGPDTLAAGTVIGTKSFPQLHIRHLSESAHAGSFGRRAYRRALVKTTEMQGDKTTAAAAHSPHAARRQQQKPRTARNMWASAGGYAAFVTRPSKWVREKNIPRLHRIRAIFLCVYYQWVCQWVGGLSAVNHIDAVQRWP